MTGRHTGDGFSLALAALFALAPPAAAQERPMDASSASAVEAALQQVHDRLAATDRTIGAIVASAERNGGGAPGRQLAAAIEALETRPAPESAKPARRPEPDAEVVSVRPPAEGPEAVERAEGEAATAEDRAPAETMEVETPEEPAQSAAAEPGRVAEEPAEASVPGPEDAPPTEPAGEPGRTAEAAPAEAPEDVTQAGPADRPGETAPADAAGVTQETTRAPEPPQEETPPAGVPEITDPDQAEAELHVVEEPTEQVARLQRPDVVAAIARAAGEEITGSDGQPLGTIIGLLRNRETGAMERVVIESGGFLGLFADEIGIPMEEVRLEDGRLVSNWSSARVERSPEITPEYNPYPPDLEWVPLE